MENYKRCSLCQETKLTTEFHKRTSGGVLSRCKNCRNASRRKADPKSDLDLSPKEIQDPSPKSPDPHTIPLPSTLFPKETKSVSFYDSNGGRKLLLYGTLVYTTAMKNYIEAYQSDPDMNQVGSDFESDEEYSILTVKNENKWRKLRIKKTAQKPS
jgi:hypothetical protein